MGTLILTMHTSADGFVATDDGEMWPAFGWPPEAQAHLNDLYREAAAVIYGRRIYETVVPFWTGIAANGLPEDMPLGETDLEFASIMSPLPKYVVSHGYDPADATTEVIDSAEVAGIVADTAATAEELATTAAGILGFALANVELTLAGQASAQTAWEVCCRFATSQMA